MLTPAAAAFVGPLTFAALSGHAVETDVLDLLPDRRIGHIVVADTRRCARRRAGDRPLAGRDGQRHRRATSSRPPASRRPRRSSSRRRWTATCGRTGRRGTTSARLRVTSATRWSPPEIGLARVRPVRRRTARGAAADRGRRGRGHRRPARSAPPDPAVAPAARPAPRATPDLEGRHVVVSAGGTARGRSIPSASSAIAARAGWASPSPRPRSPAARGSRSWPGASRSPLPGRRDCGARRVHRRRCARPCIGAVFDDRADVLVMAAAVADFRPVPAADDQARAGGESLTLELEPTEDILAEVGARRAGDGPAARPRRLRRRDRLAGSRARTSCGARAWTSSSPTTSPRPGSGFGTDTNRVTILAADGSRDDLPLLTKREVADRHPGPRRRRAGRTRRRSHTGATTTETHP